MPLCSAPWSTACVRELGYVWLWSSIRRGVQQQALMDGAVVVATAHAVAVASGVVALLLCSVVQKQRREREEEERERVERREVNVFDSRFSQNFHRKLEKV